MNTAVDEYLRPGNIRSPSYYASRIGVDTDNFMSMVELRKQEHFHKQQEMSKGFPVMAEALEKANEAAKEAIAAAKEAIAEEEESKRKRRNVTPELRAAIIKDALQGHRYQTIAEVHDVADVTVSKIMKKYREETPEPVAVNGMPEPIVAGSDIGITIEGEYFILKVPKNRLTRELLKGVL